MARTISRDISPTVIYEGKYKSWHHENTPYCNTCIHYHDGKCDISGCVLGDKYVEKDSKMLKNDSEKLRWDLLPIEPIEDIIRVLMFGASKYEENNWKNGSSKKDMDRTYAAALRHLTAWKKGEECADDSGLLHLSHAACDIIFMIYHSLTKKEMERNWD